MAKEYAGQREAADLTAGAAVAACEPKDIASRASAALTEKGLGEGLAREKAQEVVTSWRETFRKDALVTVFNERRESQKAGKK
jgi:hypothetical protein